MTTVVHRSASSSTIAAPDTPKVRPICEADVEASARAAFAAHSTLADRHGYPSEHPTLAFSIGLMTHKAKDPSAYGFVAEADGRILGSVFLNVFPPAPVAAIGPMTVDPSAEGAGAGRLLLAAALDDARTRDITQVRLIQSPANLRSLALYTKAGFEVREPLVLMQRADAAKSAAGPVADKTVRKATMDDAFYCERLCARVLGFSRSGEIRAAIEQQTANVVLQDHLIAGYATGIGFRGHAVAETSEDIAALIAAAPAIMGPGFFVPVRNTRLMRWLFGNGYRAVWQATLMSCGSYQEPAGAFLPSIAY